MKPPKIKPSQRFTGFVALTGAWVAAFQALDYIVRPRDAAFNSHLTALERYVPLEFWGAAFLIIALITAVGLYFELWPLAIFGHGSLGLLYCGLGIASWFGIFAHLEFFEWQTTSLYLGAAVVHTFLADGCYDEWSREWRRPPPPVLTLEDPLSVFPEGDVPGVQ